MKQADGEGIVLWQEAIVRLGAGLLGVGMMGLTAAAIAQSTAPQPAAQDSAAASGGTIEEVIVTARKRSENLIDTPVSVSAFSGAQLADAGTTDLSGLSSEIPQVEITKFPTGAGAIIAIRGIGSPSLDPGLESTVSTVFDGVQLSRGLITSLGFFDTQSVQVLKGPQALFFGKNSPAGVVAVTSNGPSSHWEGYAHEAYEVNAVEPYIETAVGGPLSDTLRIRFALKYDKSDGYLTNDAKPLTIPNVFAAAFPPGFAPSTVSLEGAPSAHWPTDATVLGRMVMDWVPTEEFSAKLHILGTSVVNDGAGPGFVTKCVAGPQGRPVELGISDPTGYCTPGTHVSDYVNPLIYTTPLPFSNSHKSVFTDFTGSLDSLELNFTHGPLAVTSVTGYAAYRQTYLDNVDGQFGLFDAGAEQIYTQASQELRVSSHFDFPVNFVGGALYEKTRLSNKETIFVGVGLFPPDPTTGRYESADDVDVNTGQTISPFLQGIWKIAPNLEFDAGARWTEENAHGRQYNTFINAYSLVPGLLPVGVVLDDKHSFYNLSPEATLTWHPSDETMLYGAFKTGYKSGGYSLAETLIGTLATPTTPATTEDSGYLFKPEKSSGGEIGAKSRLLNGKLQVTGAIYDYRYRDLQESIYNTTTNSFSVQNAAAASTRGVESDIIWRVMPELTLNTSLSYNRGRFSSYPNAACWGGESAILATCAASTNPHQDLSGARLPYSSEWVEQVGFSWDRTFPSSADYRFSLGSNLQYLGNFNASSDGNPTASFDPQFLLRANLSVYPDSERWKVEITGRNLLDRHYLAATTDKPGGTDLNGASDVYGPENRPREIWLQFSERF